MFLVDILAAVIQRERILFHLCHHGPVCRKEP